MARCKICNHPQRDEVDLKVISGEITQVQGMTILGAPSTSYKRHLKRCPPPKAPPVKTDITGGSTLDRLEYLFRRIQLVLDKCESDPRSTPKQMLETARVSLQLVKAHGSITGQYAADPTKIGKALAASQEWSDLQTKILAALAPHPAALEDVIAAIEGGNSTPEDDDPEDDDPEEDDQD